MPIPLPWRLGLPAAAAAFTVDQATKAWALSALWSAAVPHPVLPVLNLRLGFNTGITFGMFAGNSASAVWVLVGFGLAIVAWLLNWMRCTASRAEVFALGLIVGGALSNVLDRLRIGAVVDFLDAHYGGWHWPTFNLADVAIVCGVGTLMASALLQGDHASREFRRS